MGVGSALGSLGLTGGFGTHTRNTLFLPCRFMGMLGDRRMFSKMLPATNVMDSVL